MSEIPDNITISGGKPESPAMDYEFLRQLAHETLERLGTSEWTDFNEHDPGITILDFLCYALTDVGYRANFSIADILADESGVKQQPVENQFFTARQILHTSPVTENDYRRLVVDIEGIRNAWVVADKSYPDVKGLHRILLDVDRDLEGATSSQLSESSKKSLLMQVRRLLSANRNLCEDFLLDDHITFLEPYCLGIRAEISIESNGNAENIVAELLYRIEEHISTHVHFRSLRELMDSGELTLDKVFDGPELRHGFIPEGSLRQMVRHIDTEKIVPLIRGIRFVESIHTLGFFNVKPAAAQADDSTPDAEDERAPESRWKGISPRFRLPPNVSPFLSADSEHCKVDVMRNGQPFEYNKDEVSRKLALLRARMHHQRHAMREWDLPVPKGRNRTISRHQSVQYDFPFNYGVGPYGLPHYADDHRKAQSKQLKAFLLLFDQLLANQLSQIANLQNLLSWDMDIRQTYFPKAVERIPPVSTQLDEEKWLSRMRQGPFRDGGERNFLKELLADSLQADTLDETAARYQKALSTMAEDRATAVKRRDKALRHLMARFAEEFAEYYQFVISQEMDERQEDLIVRNRIEFLRHYPSISKSRGQGRNYTEPEDFEKNYSGFKKRVALLLGFDPDALQSGANAFNQRFELSKSDTANPSPDIEWELTTEDGSPLDLTGVLQHADNEKKYAVVKEGDGRYIIALFDAELHLKGNVLFITRNTFPDLLSASLAKVELLKLLTRYQRTTENFHVVEHILLRPEPEDAVFTFTLTDTGGTPQAVFSPGRSFTLAQRTELLQKSLRKSGDWKPLVRGSGDFWQVDISLGVDGVVLRSPEGFDSKAAALACFDRLAQANYHHSSDGLKLFIETDFNLFSDTGLRDPYSFVLSIVLPDWPTRFRASGFRKVVEHTLRAEAPAHLLLNILWLDKLEMQEFERLLGKWTQAKETGSDASAYAKGLLGFLQQHQLQQIFQVG